MIIMTRKQPHTFVYASAVVEHLRAIESQYHALIREAIEQHVTRIGKPVAVLVGVQDEEEIKRLLMACSPRLPAVLDQARRQLVAGQGRSHEQFWSEVKGPEDTRK